MMTFYYALWFLKSHIKSRIGFLLCKFNPDSFFGSVPLLLPPNALEVTTNSIFHQRIKGLSLKVILNQFFTLLTLV